MDTLVAISVLAGLGWSLYALFLGGAGVVTARQDLAVDLRWVDSPGQIYLASAVAVTLVALTGRYLAVWADDATAGGLGAGGAFTAVGAVSAIRQRAAGKGRVGDRMATVVAVMAFSLSAATLGFWLAAGAGTAADVGPAVAVLMVACPGGLVLAGSPAAALAVRRGALLGIRLEHPGVLAVARRVDTVVVGTAGTLTTGRPILLDVVTTDGTTVEETIRVVGAVGLRSAHPVTRAVAAVAHERGIALDAADLVVDSPGLGVRAVVGGQNVWVGGGRFVADGAGALPPHLVRTQAAAEAASRTTVPVGWDGSIRAVLVVVDPVRSTAVEAVDNLVASGLRTVLLTSEERRTADAVAANVGINEVMAPVVPREKEGAVRLLQSEGRVVAVLDAGGDSVGVGGRADVCLVRVPATPAGAGPEDATGQGPDLWVAADVLRLCRAAGRIVRQNLFWAAIGTILGVALAVAGRLSPTWALAVVAGSVLVVVANSLRLCRFRSARPPAHRRTG